MWWTGCWRSLLLPQWFLQGTSEGLSAKVTRLLWCPSLSLSSSTNCKLFLQTAALMWCHSSPLVSRPNTKISSGPDQPLELFLGQKKSFPWSCTSQALANSSITLAVPCISRKLMTIPLPPPLPFRNAIVLRKVWRVEINFDGSGNIRLIWLRGSTHVVDFFFLVCLVLCPFSRASNLIFEVIKHIVRWGYHSLRRSLFSFAVFRSRHLLSFNLFFLISIILFVYIPQAVCWSKWHNDHVQSWLVVDLSYLSSAMALPSKVIFSDMCLNGFLSFDGDSKKEVRECMIFQREARLVVSLASPPFSYNHSVNC